MLGCTGSVPTFRSSEKHGKCLVHPSGQSTIASGCFTGRLLGDVLSEYPSLLGKENELPILIKLIDAQSDLSVQVHPDDAYAISHEEQHGKTEMWYILEAQPGAQLVLGFTARLHDSWFVRLPNAVGLGRLTAICSG